MLEAGASLAPQTPIPMTTLKSSLACQNPSLRLGHIVDYDMLGTLSLSVVIDGEVKRPSHAGHLQVVVEAVEYLSKRVRESRQRQNVKVGVPVDAA